MDTRKRRVLFAALLLGTSPAAIAQLVDATKTGPSVPGGAIEKSLADQIGAGQGDLFTPGSAAYLIYRDPARSIRRGRQLFQRKFSAAEGLGPRVNPDSSGSIADNPALGAGLSDSCAACHGRPRGAAGFGGDVNTRPDSRDAPHLFGLGLVEMLADEITADLRPLRAEAVSAAEARDRSVVVELQSKGIGFGSLVAHADGSVDASGVEGIDEDLRIKPFFHHGATISMREFIIGAFKDEMGLQSADPILCAVTDPVRAEPRTSAAGMVFDPALDTFERPPSCDPEADPDGDSVSNEIDPALVDHMEFYLLNYFKPGQGRVTRKAERGLKVMESIGCTDCHVKDLVIENDRRVADVETVFDRRRGIFNRLFATAETLFTTVDDGAEYPLLVPNQERFVVRNFFGDFKRHDLGPAFHERQHNGEIVTEFVTEPLWGVATTAPYGHDGRSINLTEVILRHGGEAEESKRNFERLSGRERNQILTFLRTLVLFPPDDTASNLNPGNKYGDPQTEHGSINLGALFQIDEGPE